MSEYIRADKQILVATLGMMSSLLTGIILGLIEVYSGYALYSWMFWFVIPVGALLAGFGAASGYYAGAMLFHQKPAGGILFNMVAASVSAFFIVHYIPYYMLVVDGIRVKETISFWQYFDMDVRNTSLSSFRGGVSTGELGSFWGYAYAGLQLLGFSVGGFAVFGWLSENPYCEKCSRYLEKTGKQERFTSGGGELVEQLKNFAALLDARQCNDAIRYQSENMGVEYSSGHHLRSRIITRVCPTCKVNHMDFITSKQKGNDWEDINDTAIRLFTEEPLEISVKS
jgi:hypothetical protein